MKNLVTNLFLLILCFSIISCEDESTEKEINHLEKSLKNIDISFMYDLSDTQQRNRFHLLNTEQKMKMRYEIIENYIEAIELNERQREILINLEKFITHKFFENQEFAETQKAFAFSEWYQDAVHYFPLTHLDYLCNGTLVRFENEITYKTNTCSCHIDSYWFCTTTMQVELSASFQEGVGGSVTQSKVPCENSNGCREPGRWEYPDGDSPNYDRGRWLTSGLGCGWFLAFACNGSC